MQDELEFERYVAARWSTFHRLALLLTASDSGAEALVQVTWEKAYAAGLRVSEMAAPDAYVRRIMVNSLTSSHRRAWNRRERPTAALADAGVASVEGDVLDHALLWPLVCALPEPQRAAVVLRYYEDLTEQEIAEILGCALGAVQATAHDAMAALQRGLAAVPVPGGVDA